jgi:hypothetical protein
MRIAEISSPGATHRGSPPHQLLLSQIESSIKQLEQLSPAASQDDRSSSLHTLSSDLRRSFAQLTHLAPFNNDLKLHLWKLSFRLWNACVDLSNAASFLRSSPCAEHHAELRHVASDILALAGDVPGVPSPALKSAAFYHKTGLLWHDLRRLDLASACFVRATDLVSELEHRDVSGAGERKLLLDLNLARSRTAWEASDRNLSLALLNRSKSLLFGSAEHYWALANQYLAFGKGLLSKDDQTSNSEALKLMNESLDLCEKGLGSRSSAVDLRELRAKTLRFISAVHLQKGEYESVIKCVRVLRDQSGDRSHPSLPVLAVKAWLGLGRYGEAEKELRGMAVNKGVPQDVWVSAVEAYFQAVGTAGSETAKDVFLGLLGRCHINAGAAVRLAHRVVGEGGSDSKVRAKVAAELVSDERVVELFTGEAAAKERMSMHAVLWNW